MFLTADISAGVFQVFTHNRFKAALCVAALALFAACGGEGTTSPQITPPVVVTPPAPVTLVSRAIVGVTSLLVGDTKSYALIETYSNGTTKDVTFFASWSSTAPAVAGIVATGVATALTPGDAQISASFSGSSVMLAVVVKRAGTPWSQLPSLSEAAKTWVKAYNFQSEGKVVRFADGPIKVWAQPAFKAQDIVDAQTFWATATGGKISFVSVADSTSAQIIFVVDATVFTQDVCGRGGGTASSNNALTAGKASINPGCVAKKTLLAHELGHILGFMGHDAPGASVMSPDADVSGLSPFLAEIAKWVYSVPLGTTPIDG